MECLKISCATCSSGDLAASAGGASARGAAAASDETSLASAAATNGASSSDASPSDLPISFGPQFDLNSISKNLLIKPGDIAHYRIRCKNLDPCARIDVIPHLGLLHQRLLILFVKNLIVFGRFTAVAGSISAGA